MGGVCCILVREVKCIKGSDRKFQVRLLGRCTCRQADNKKIILEIYDGGLWFGIIWLRHRPNMMSLNMVMNLQVP